MLVIGVIEPGRHRRAQQGELDARLQPRALPDPRRHDDLRLLSGEDIGADDDLAAAAVREELEHPHRASQVEVEDLFGRQPMHLGEGVGRQQVVDRGAERSIGLDR